jgi:hypothetical protein
VVIDGVQAQRPLVPQSAILSDRAMVSHVLIVGSGQCREAASCDDRNNRPRALRSRPA